MPSTMEDDRDIWSIHLIPDSPWFGTDLILENVILFDIGAAVGVVPLDLNHRPYVRCS